MNVPQVSARLTGGEARSAGRLLADVLRGDGEERVRVVRWEQMSLKKLTAHVKAAG